jgi:CMP-N-acetylneuraminic acid synthetase
MLVNSIYFEFGMKIVVLIPMKGYSERVKNKNMREFSNSPLYHATVREIMQSKYSPLIVINTDSEVIKQDVAQHFPHILVLDRPEALIGDLVPMNDIIGHDIEQVEADIFVQTHSTNPLMLASTLDRAIEAFIEQNDVFDSVFSVTRFQTRLYWQDGSAINHNPSELIRTQDLPPVFEENSNFFVFTKQSFKAAGNKRIGLKPMMFEIDKIEAVDIDEPIDFTIAEILYKSLRMGNPS